MITAGKSKKTHLIEQPPTPVRMLTVIVISIFIAELFVMFILHYLPSISAPAKALIDSSLLIIIVIPFIYFLVYRPLTRTAKVHEDAEIELEKLTESLEAKVEERTEEIIKSETEHRAVLESTSDVILRIDTEGKILSANQATMKSLGYRSNDLLGKNISFIIPDDFPKLLVKGFISSLDEWNGDRGQNSMELLANNSVGEKIPVELTISECIIKSETIYVLIMRDISLRRKTEQALKKSEGQLRLITTSANDAIFKLTENGDVMFWNPAAERIFGYTRGELIGKKLCDFILPEDNREKNKSVFEVPDKTGNTPVPSKTIEMFATRKNGESFQIELSVSSIWMEEGWRTIGIVRDITERKIAEEELRKAKEEAEDATKLKDKFVSLVSHDLRGPLSGMKSLLGLVQEKKMDEAETEKVLKMAVNSSGDMLALIEDLLDVSRMKTGKIKLEQSFIDAHSLAAKIEPEFSYLAQQKGIKLVNKIPENSRIYADKGMFYVVLRNLVSNAIKFCDGNDTITIFMPDGDLSSVAVKDTGAGISPERLRIIFNYEEDTSTVGTKGEKGTGLGLPLCRDIMKAHGGTLTVDSEKGRGSTFYARLPDVKPTILLVDDDESVRREFIANLKEFNMDIIEAKTGEGASEILEKIIPHLIVTDIAMPDMGELELLKRIKANPLTEPVPVILISAKTTLADRQKAFQMGAIDFVTKPLLAEELIQKIRKLVS